MITLAIFLFLGGFFHFIFWILWFILVVLALMDLFKSTLPTNTKLLWLIVILIAPVLGSVIYLLWGKYQRF